MSLLKAIKQERGSSAQAAESGLELTSRQNVEISSIIPNLAAMSGFTTLNSFINSSSSFFNLLNTASEFTFLAPTDTAFNNWFASFNGTPPTNAVIEATLQYHLLNGSFNTATAFGTNASFAQSYLTNQTYSNVTIPPPGQRLELIQDANGNPTFVSYNKSVTTISKRDDVCLGGLIQVIDSILTVPKSLINLATDAGINYFLAILNKSQFLSLDKNELIAFVNTTVFQSNLMFLLPNTPFAVAEFNNATVGITADGLRNAYNYHIANGVFYTSDLYNGRIITMRNGYNVTVSRNETDIFFNQAKVIHSDYLAMNGVVHIIDSLLNYTHPTLPAGFINATTAAPSNSSSPSSSNSSSSGAKASVIGPAVAIPVAFVLALAAFLFWFLRKKKAKKTRQHELDASIARQEMETNIAAKELHGTNPSKEMDASRPPVEFYAPHGVNELYSPHGPHPVELDASPSEPRE